MGSETKTGETFSEFRLSFSYGTRTDLNFKFLKGLTDEEAAQFFRDLLWRVGDTLDDGDLSRLEVLVFEWQQRGYSLPTQWRYETAPLTRLKRPLAESRLGLLASSGHFVAGDDPEPFGVASMTQDEAIARIGEFLSHPPVLSVIPKETPREKLCARHGGYDVRGARLDPNVVFPIERLLELEAIGIIGELAANAYSFVGAAAQTPLSKEVAPRWIRRFQKEAIDAFVLVPV